MPRIRALILDAGPVLELHRIGAWENAAACVQLIVPGIVIDREVYYYNDNATGRQVTIDLREAAQSDKIERFDATATEMRSLLVRFGPNLQERIDPGEQEALVALVRFTDPNTFLVSADQACVRAATLIDEDTRLISLETVLQRIGLTKTIQDHFTEAAFQRWLRDALIARVQGRDLAG